MEVHDERDDVAEIEIEIKRDMGEVGGGRSGEGGGGSGAARGGGGRGAARGGGSRGGGGGSTQIEMVLFATSFAVFISAMVCY